MNVISDYFIFFPPKNEKTPPTPPSIHPAPLRESAEKKARRDGLCNSHYDYSQAERSRAKGRALPPLPSPRPLPQPPRRQAQGLLPKLPHDLLDPGQVGLGDGEVAAGGPHVVAHLAGLGGGSVALGLDAHHVLARVEETPVIPISSWRGKKNVGKGKLETPTDTEGFGLQPWERLGLM